MALTPKQKTFVQEYLVDLNATQAAVRAGYSQKRASEIGYQLLQKTTVQAAIHDAMEARQQRTEVTQDYVIDKLREIAEMAEGIPFILKGIMTVRGAEKALEAGASGIVVSNHGGRVLDQCPATAEVLPEIVKAVGGRMKVLVDGDQVDAIDLVAPQEVPRLSIGGIFKRFLDTLFCRRGDKGPPGDHGLCHKKTWKTPVKSMFFKGSGKRGGANK